MAKTKTYYFLKHFFFIPVIFDMDTFNFINYRFKSENSMTKSHCFLIVNRLYNI